MATSVEKTQNSPSLKSQKLLFVSQIFLRLLAFAATLSAAWIMLTSKQTSIVFGLEAQARYSYSPAFKFFAYANLTVCAFTIMSLFLAFILGNRAVDPTCYFYMFLLDLAMTILLMAGCAAATSVGYIGKHGNSHAGWAAICGYFGKFCSRATAASSLSYLAFIFYLILTVISANSSRYINL
ncbi:hypothetical protein ACS0TY_033969 [Phlomoides rotata]